MEVILFLSHIYLFYVFDRKILRRRKLGDKVIPKVTVSSIADNRINNNRNEMK